MALLEIRNVTRRFGAVPAVDNVSMGINAGEFFTLLGPSGCGKTTLLRMIAGFQRPDSGSILLEGRDLADTPPERRPVHTVFQSYALFPHMTVAENAAFPLRMADLPREDIAARVTAALDMVHLGDKGASLPQELSGGQKQRVAIARALISRPRLLLLDEPLAALDAKLREKLQIELISLQRDVGITFVYVTHDQTEALALSHRIAVMNAGRVEQLDEPSRIYGFPANRFVADFIGNCNLIDARVLALEGGHARLAVERLGEIEAPAGPGAAVGERVLLALRPEQIAIAGPDAVLDGCNRFRGTVREYVYVGDVTTYIVTLENGGQIEALLPNSAAGRTKFFEIGDAVQVAWRQDAGHVMPESAA